MAGEVPHLTEFAGLGTLRPVAKPEVWNGIDIDGRLHSKLMDVACGAAHTVVITDDGELLTWGDNDSGQLGVPPKQVQSLVLPKLLPWPLGHKVIHMACGLKHTLALLDTGAVVSWGYGKSGALGHGNRENVDSPREVLSLRGMSVFQVACGDMHSAVVLNSGELITAGWSENGRLGRVKSLDVCGCTFERVDLKGKLCSWVACGGAHTMCLTDQYEVFAFGANTFGQLGVGDCRDRAYPVEVVFFRNVRVHHVVLGKFHSMAISDDRLLYAWGNGEQGQCGLGAFPHIYMLPHLVTSILGCPVFQVAAGDAFTLILTSNTPASVKELAGRDEHWRLRQQHLITTDKAHREAVQKNLENKSQEKFHATLHANNSFLAVLQKLHQSSNLALANGAIKLTAPPSPDTIAAAVMRSGLCRQRSLEKLQFVVDASTLAQVHDRIHSPCPSFATSVGNHHVHKTSTHDHVRTTKSILAQSPSLQRALKSAASLQRPRSGLAACVGSPRRPQQTIQVIATATPSTPAATSPTVKPQWLLQQRQVTRLRLASQRPRTPPPTYTTVDEPESNNVSEVLEQRIRPPSPPPDYNASVVALLGLQCIQPAL
ncbi:hypothetical protein, variant [Aphanomyces invadans]|uniref:RCC1-like domain-containing protein n=1 Tax=Aphanomyces invadans TaxID=157072 RepID=A0A024UUK7_9STRA|nr:hypothetical protein, variant [Aphanomyces invadans]ETW10206.1 hypothetical protein, variant [Aphanomyces invadans]|eukprot:XP_008861617.1 hypothetical protein, variant [Aphanomyces invadans]